MKKEIEKIFNSSAQSRAKPFWSLNGKLEKEELFRQIDVMNEMGFGGAFLHSRTGLETEYMSEEWLSLMEACVDKLASLGMEAWLYDEDRWPSGTCGGLVTKRKSNRLKSIICEEILPENYKKPSHLIALFSARITDGTVWEYKRINSVAELSPNCTLLVFSWIYMEPMAFYNGYTYIDTLNKSAVKEFLNLTHEKYKRKMGVRFGNDVKGIFQDEVNRGPLLNGFVVGDEKRLLRIPYTYKLFDTFKRLKTYDLRDFLPLLYYKNGEENFSYVMYDYTQVVMKMLLENFAKPYYGWCRENNLKSTGHVLHEDSLACQTTMMGSVMQYYEYMDYPGIDNLGTCNYRYEVPKLASSVTKQFGKGHTLSELYGCSGWQMKLDDYKHDGDWQAFMGINFRCPHLAWYTMKGEAKRDCPASIMSQSAWYKDYRKIEDYFSTLNLCLNVGEDMVENLIINPIESSWGLSRLGAYVNIFGVSDETYQDLESKYCLLFEGLQKRGVDADFGDEEHIAKYGRVEDGLFYIGRKGYKRVVVSNLLTIRKTTLNLLNKFVGNGGEVVFIARYPVYLDGRRCNEQLFKDYKILPFDIDLIAKTVKETEYPISIVPSNGIFVRKRKTASGMIIALLNSSKNECKSVSIGLPTDKNIGRIDVRSRQVKHVEFSKNERGGIVNYAFAPGEELVLFETDDVILPTIIPNGRTVEISVDKFKYDLSEDNFLVLDRVCLFDGEKWDESDFILSKDFYLRQKHGIELRFGEMIQPWFKEKFTPEKWRKPHGKYKIEYSFTLLEEVYEPIYIMMEDADKFIVELNGNLIETDCGIESNIDVCFKKYLLNKQYLKIGGNVITLSFDFSDSTNLEAIYLCGKFAVTKDGKGVFTLPKELPIGDITEYGLPFYSGELTYYLPVENGEYRVEFNRIDAATVRVEGEPLAFSPYKSNYHSVSNALAITYVFNRKNLFGNNVNTAEGIVRELQLQGMIEKPNVFKK